jgi:hypothetical protein
MIEKGVGRRRRLGDLRRCYATLAVLGFAEKDR